LKKKFFFNKICEPNIKKYLDLVALGTVCDLVPLKKINRLFVKKGIEVINKKKNEGIQMLIDRLNIDRNIDSSDISFYLGPCINAPGRVGESILGFKLLSLKYKNQLTNTIDTILRNNKERKTLESIACREAKDKIYQTQHKRKNRKKNFILSYNKNWHPGIIGIIAGRLTKEFSLPSVVISSKNNSIKGSIRSIKGIHANEIIEFMHKNKLVINGGGHKMAGGFTLKNNTLDLLPSVLDDYFKNKDLLKEDNLDIDIILELHSLNLNEIEKIKSLGPFGQENEEPRVVIRQLRPIFSKIVGKFRRHIFCVLEDIYGNTINAMAFNEVGSNIGKVIGREKVFNVAGKLNIYESEKQRLPQIIIEDILVL